VKTSRPNVAIVEKQRDTRRRVLLILTHCVTKVGRMSRYKCIGQYIVFYISYCFIPSITLNDIEQIVNVTQCYFSYHFSVTVSVTVIFDQI